MLLFAHTGIAVGGAWVLQRSGRFLKGTPKGRQENVATGTDNKSAPAFGRRIDYRLLILGALLPDIIDKPLGIYLLPDQLGTGRVYSHTLLFLIVIAFSGLAWYLLKRSTAMLVVAAGVFSHLAADQMWANPKTLLWPLYGAGFEPLEGEWLGGVWHALTADPGVYIPEIIGMVIVAIFAWNIFAHGGLGQFLRTGRLFPIQSPEETGRETLEANG